MNRFSNALLPAALLLLVFAASSALLAAAWLLTSFCLNGLNRFTLPLGLFSAVLLLTYSPTFAQNRPADEYIVVFERTNQPTVIPNEHAPLRIDTAQRKQTMGNTVRRRKLKPVPAWPDDAPTEKSTNVPADVPLFIFIPELKPGSSEVKGLIGIRIRP